MELPVPWRSDKEPCFLPTPISPESFPFSVKGTTSPLLRPAWFDHPWSLRVPHPTSRPSPSSVGWWYSKPPLSPSSLLHLLVLSPGTSHHHPLSSNLAFSMGSQADIPPVVVCSGCPNKAPQIGGWHSTNEFPTILEAGSPRLWCWQGWLLLRPFSLCLYMVFSLSVS